jgi:hypothetical protein
MAAIALTKFLLKQRNATQLAFFRLYFERFTPKISSG